MSAVTVPHPSYSVLYTDEVALVVTSRPSIVQVMFAAGFAVSVQQVRFAISPSLTKLKGNWCFSISVGGTKDDIVKE